MSEIAKPKRWRKTTGALGVLLAAGMLAGASLIPAHVTPVHAATTIRYWGPFSGPDGATMVKMVKQFNASQSSVVVQYNTETFTSYDQALSTAISAHKAPEMWVDNGNDVVATFAAARSIQPLEKLTAKMYPLQKQNYPTGIWNGGLYGGHVYGIPISALPLVYYWNKALFRKAKLNPTKPPTTLKALLKMSAAVKKATKGSAWGFVVPPAWPEPFLFPSLLAQFGGKEMDVKAKKSLVGSTAGIKAATLLRDLIYKYKASPPNTAPDQDLQLLPTGRAASIVDGPWQYTRLHDAMGADLGVGALPKFGKKKAVFVGTNYFSINKDASAAQAKAALAFVSYFEKHSLTWARTGDLPNYKAVIRSTAFKRLTFLKAISSMLPYGVISPQYPKYGPSYGHYIYDQLDPILRGRKPPSAMKIAQANINKAIASTSG